MEGIGNDFIVIDGTHLPQTIDWPAAAIKYCDRRYGIGADGIVLVLPAQGPAEIEMRIFNSDGSEPQMCGNGIRCLAKFAVSSGMAAHHQFSVKTLGGIKTVEITPSQAVVVDMGIPELVPERIPVNVGGQDPCLRLPIEVAGVQYNFTAVSMGNPHAVVFLPEISQLDLPKIGPLFEHHDMFPERVNTEFVVINSRQEVTMRVWERGSGETLACGTGACAIVVAGVLNNLTDRQVRVHLPGGDLEIEWNEADGHVWMTGPATVVYKGEFEL